MKSLLLAVTLALTALVAVPSVAYAQDAGVPASAEEAPEAPPAPAGTPAEKAEEDPLSTAGELVSAVKNGNWRLAVALALGFLMMLLGRFRNKLKWFKGDRGGAVLVMVLSLAGALSTALASSASMDWKLFLGAAGVAWTAVGGYTWAKRLIWPKDVEQSEGE